MMMFNFYRQCDKDDPKAIVVKNGFAKFHVRSMTSQEIGMLFSAVGQWYADEEYKNHPIEYYIKKLTMIEGIYCKLNMSQSQIAAVVMRRSWLIAVENNELDYKPVFIPFSFEKMDSMLSYQLNYFVHNDTRPV